MLRINSKAIKKELEEIANLKKDNPKYGELEHQSKVKLNFFQRLASSINNKVKCWWKKYICDIVPSSLEDMFDEYNQNKDEQSR